MSKEIRDIVTALNEECVSYVISVGFRRFCAKLKAQDLGLDEGIVDPKRINLGNKYLLGSLHEKWVGALSKISREVGSTIEENSFLYFKTRLVPNKALAKVSQKLKELERQFMEHAAQFMANYSTIKQQAVDEWEVWAMMEGGKLSPQQQAEFVAKIEAAFPSLEKLAASFKFSVQMTSIQAPKEITLKVTQEKEQRAMMDARNALAREAHSKFIEENEKMVNEMVSTLRAQCAETCQEMLGTIEDGKTGVHQKTLNRMLKFIDRFKGLNFFDDAALEKQLDEFKEQFLIKSAADYREDEDAKAALKNAIKGLGAQAKELAEQDVKELVESFKGKRHIQLED